MWLPAPLTRLVAGLLAVMLVAAGCGAESSSDEVTALDSPVGSIAVPEAEPALLEVLPGRVAIAAAQGTPHILWFWGAH
jgi:hypothetical protein